MGAYIYRVTAERVKLTDGREANVAKYAYKPSWGDSKWNAQMAFRSGVPASRKLVAEGRATGLIVTDTFPGSPVYPFNGATFVDDSFNRKPLDGVVVANPKAKVQQMWTVEYTDKGAVCLGGPMDGKHPVQTKVVPADNYPAALALVLSISPKYAAGNTNV